MWRRMFLVKGVVTHVLGEDVVTQFLGGYSREHFSLIAMVPCLGNRLVGRVHKHTRMTVEHSYHPLVCPHLRDHFQPHLGVCVYPNLVICVPEYNIIKGAMQPKSKDRIPFSPLFFI